ncbi:MAG: prepilin-type N-terminal cleavage/methylation domain-containing protein [Planctomycetota bacterium]|jgi:prepilin-type N-terminal cleavage/methylation domain-containing protein
MTTTRPSRRNLPSTQQVDRRREGGFTMIEMSIVMTILVPILVGIAVTTSSVNNTMEADSRRADVMTYCRRMSQRIAKLVRPAQMTTITVQAVQEDVTMLRAAAVGDWIAPTDLVWRPGIEFRSASGLLSMNAALLTSPRRIVFALEPSETDNDIDDDGDGLVDEGTITLLQNDITLAILKDVEECSFALDGRILKMRLRVARRSSERRIYRNFLEQRFYLRNN